MTLRGSVRADDQSRDRPGLRITSSTADGVTTLEVSGEVDLASADQLCEAATDFGKVLRFGGREWTRVRTPVKRETTCVVHDGESRRTPPFAVRPPRDLLVVRISTALLIRRKFILDQPRPSGPRRRLKAKKTLAHRRILLC